MAVDGVDDLQVIWLHRNVEIRQKNSQLSDLDFIRAFEDCKFCYEEWTHEAHLRMGWHYLRTFDLKTAIEKSRTGIQKLNSVIGVRGRGYHETITQFYLYLIQNAIRRTNAESWDEFLKENSFLLERSLLGSYYSAGLLNSAEAKVSFLQPDLRKLLDESQRSGAIE